MEKLPPELLDRIVAYSDHASCKNLRLAHRLLHDAASASVFREVHMGVFKFGLQKLEAIVASPLARHVRSFTFYWDVLPQLTRAEWERRIDHRPEFQDFYQSCKEDARGEDWFSRAKCRQWYSSLDRHKYGKADLDIAWSAWSDYYRDQRCWREISGSERMAGAICKLQHLRHVESRIANCSLYQIRHPASRCALRWDGRCNDTPLWRKIAPEILMGPDDWTDSCSISLENLFLDPAALLLAALKQRASDLNASPLVSLKLHHQHRTRPNRNSAGVESTIGDSSHHELTTRALSSVQKLQLNITHDLTSDQVSTFLPLKVMAFLEAARQLRVLDLKCAPRAGRGTLDNRQQDGLVPLFRRQEATWPMLEQLILSVDTESADLLQFLHAHRKTLRSLELWNMKCEDWKAVLMPLPQMLGLESVYLESLWQSERCVNGAEGAYGLQEYQYRIFYSVRDDARNAAACEMEQYLLGNREIFPELV